MHASTRQQRLPVDERRASIVEAAGRMFGEKGYDATRVDDIAAAIGVTKPILYRHFDSKQALYIALLERHREDLGSFPAVIPTEGSIEERMRAVLEVWIDYVETHSYAWKMLFRDNGGGPDVAEVRLGVHARAREVLVGLIRSLSEAPIPRRELQPLAELLSMGMASLVLWWMDHPEVPRDAVVDAIVRVWAGVLGTPG